MAQYSAQEIYTKILNDSEYAQFIRDQLGIAREGATEEEREAALDALDGEFALSTDELNLLGLPARSKCRPSACTDTNPTLFLLDFATATQNWPSGE